MKKYIILGVLTLILAAAAYAQKASSTVPAAAPPAASPVTAPRAQIAPTQVAQAQPPSPEALKAPDAAQFSLHKQKLLENLNEHIAKMQKKQSCISGATNETALNACFSEESHAPAVVKP